MTVVSGCFGRIDQKRLIRLPRELDHGFSEIFFRNLWDLFIFLGLDDMGIHALKIRVNLTWSRGAGENDVVLVHLPYAWR